jgi:hypothetical protein
VVNEVVDTYPHQMFIPNCHYDAEVMGKYRVLAWNMVGIVNIRKEFQFTSIDVDFMNK